MAQSWRSFHLLIACGTYQETSCLVTVVLVAAAEDVDGSIAACLPLPVVGAGAWADDWLGAEVGAEVR